MILTFGEKELYANKTVCYLCGKEINKNDKMRIKVTDHCHYTRKQRGAAHLGCNLRYKENIYISAIAHNSSGYSKH